MMPYPLLCRPVYQERIWGGRRLAERLGRELPGEQPIGEAWEVADLPEGVSSVANGPAAGATLRELVEAWGEALIGTSWPAGRFPLLVKLLDAQDDLSVQVHPSDEQCRTSFPGHHGKDESWVVLHTEPGSRIICGARPGTTADELAARIADGTVLDCLRQVRVRPGDVVRVPPGVIHALGRGVMVLEIQQPSDSTFRLYDYGRGRELHIEEARAVSDLAWQEPAVLRPQVATTAYGSHAVLVDVPAYRLERLRLERPLTWPVDRRSAQVLHVLGGRAMLACGHDSLSLAPGHTIILPASAGQATVTPQTPTDLVLAGAGGVPMAGEEG